MTRFVLIGYGWRADFFHRIAEELAGEFEISAVVTRTKERAEQVQQQYGGFATDDLEAALDTKPDFAVLCVPRSITKDYLLTLMKKGIPVLCETPPARDTDQLNELWQEKQRLEGRIQAAEQYFLQPLYGAVLKIIEGGRLGAVNSISLSALHGYHAVSIFRKALGIRYENCTITGKRFSYDVTSTRGRDGFDYSGRVIKEERDQISLVFENGQAAFFDFSNEYYFSPIRTRRMNIQGVRGEINNTTVHYLNSDNIPVASELKRIDQGVYGISGWSHQGIMLEDQFVYQNPFAGARLNDDELAVAHCLRHMKLYVDTGREFYPLEEALQDTYLSFVMEDAAQQGAAIETESQSWTK